MKNLSIPRQMLLLVTVLVGVTVVTSFTSYTALRRSLGDSAALTRRVMADMKQSYDLLSQLSEAQSAIQNLLREKDPDEIEKGIKKVEAREKQNVGVIAALGESGQAIHKQYTALAAHQKAVIDHLLRGNGGAAYEYFLANCHPQYEKVLAEVRNFHETEVKATNGRLQEQQHRLQSMLVVRMSVLAAVLLVLVAVSWWIKRTIVNRLTTLAQVMSSGADQVVEASGQVNSASQSLAQGASESAASLEETSASLEEMASMTRRNVENAEQVKDLATHARQAGDAGSADMETMSAAMSGIKQASDDVAKIVKTIDEIAFQTNILALNAAVEAARAGQAGAGFAVVADEVRNLAQRAAQAARETAEKIQDSVAKSEHGVAISGKVAQSLAEIVSKARQVDELAAQVATASKEQNQGITQVNTAVSQMDKVTQGNAASAEESASAAEELNAQARSMQAAVGELLKLVGGGGTTAPKPVAPAELAKVSAPGPVTARGGPARLTTVAKRNGNGKPLPAVRSASKDELPMPGDGLFKDF